MKPLNSNNCNPQKRLSDMMAKKSENSIDIYYTIYQEFFLLLDIRNLLKTVTLLNICRNRHAIIAYVKIRTVAFI